jgi:hypothetical protein
MGFLIVLITPLFNNAPKDVLLETSIFLFYISDVFLFSICFFIAGAKIYSYLLMYKGYRYLFSVA